MLPEAGAFELIFLAAVALIVVGPKDLPVLLRKVGQFTARMRGLAAEFRSSFDEMARQSELDDLRREVEALRTGQMAQGLAPVVEGHFREISDHLTAPAQASAYGEAMTTLPPGEAPAMLPLDPHPSPTAEPHPPAAFAATPIAVSVEVK